MPTDKELSEMVETVRAAVAYATALRVGLERVRDMAEVGHVRAKNLGEDGIAYAGILRHVGRALGDSDSGGE